MNTAIPGFEDVERHDTVVEGYEDETLAEENADKTVLTAAAPDDELADPTEVMTALSFR